MPEVGVSLALREQQKRLLRQQESQQRQANDSLPASSLPPLPTRRRRIFKQQSENDAPSSPITTPQKKQRKRPRSTTASSKRRVVSAVPNEDSHDHSQEGASRRNRSSKRQPRGEQKSNNTKANKHQSLQLFLEGAALYGLCMILPAAVSAIWRWNQQFFYDPHTNGSTPGLTQTVLGHVCSQPLISSLPWCQHMLFHRNSDDSYPQQPPLLNAALAPDAGMSDVALVVLYSMVLAVGRLFLVHWLVPHYGQPKRLEALVRCKSVHLLSAQYPGTVTPRASLRVKKNILDDQDDNGVGGFPMLPNLANSDAGAESGSPQILDARMLVTPNILFGEADRSGSFAADNAAGDDDDAMLHHHNNANPQEDKDDEHHHRSMSPESPSSRYFLSDHEDSNIPDDDDSYNPYDDDDDENDVASAPAVSSGLMTSSSALSLQNLLHQATPLSPPPRRKSAVLGLTRRGSRNPHNTNDDPGASQEEPERLFAAPKYATAVFRLIFCSVSCVIALYYFLDADFWPPALGGSGSTKNCWDLSSVGATVMDSDFDQHNTVLRRYYLVQASYHFHSAAFHFLAAMLLWCVSAKTRKNNSHDEFEDASKFLGFIPAGMMTIQNVRSLFQHCFAIGLILFTYLFSSLRRLGVVAIFAFDVSSWFLHLLQMCINAPRGTRKVSPRFIRVLHRFFVIPTFCYSRFYIFPFVVGYSSLEESQDWLRQLENMLFPGSASYIHGTFVVSFLITMILNVVYVRRLIYHPHVKDSLTKAPQR